MAGFRELRQLSDHLHGAGWYFKFVGEWSDKRNQLKIQLQDIPVLEQAFLGRATWPDECEPRITVFDAAHAVRLSNACEATSNLVYSMAEVAAKFANKVTARTAALRASFHDIVKSIEKGKAPKGLAEALANVEWYSRVRELRTEWAHYSTPFVGDEEGRALLVVRGYRSPDDKHFVKTNTTVFVDDFLNWCRSASEALDGFAEWLLVNHVVPGLDLARRTHVFVRTASGFPEMDGRGIPRTRELTFAQLLDELGIHDSGQAT